MINGVKHRVLTKDIAYSGLKEKIIYGELKPDQVVREESLATLLGISRTPLREAIQMLEMEEFLVRHPNGRLTVANVTKEEVEEIFTVRSMLEGNIAKHAARNATEKDVEKLAQYLEKIRQSFKLGYTQEFVSFGNEFHDYICEISGLTTSVRLLNMVKDHVNRYCRFVSLYGKWSPEADEEHDLILHHIKEKNGVGAELAMKEHILSSLSAVLERIEELEKAEG
ncbi:GntR family transcriptional regulator [Litchfieldia alkalitelluris]|uniref:GntR family transcriptional regulator n=1 Tax=Litchfieldia alkalitelluris TaxID=304268 RepID=UPI0014767275|nr:GntR family transcriptional regulator [Litchfieldia alkalitelluris]